jgi:hypothetical protein
MGWEGLSSTLEGPSAFSGASPDGAEDENCHLPKPAGPRRRSLGIEFPQVNDAQRRPDGPPRSTFGMRTWHPSSGPLKTAHRRHRPACAYRAAFPRLEALPPPTRRPLCVSYRLEQLTSVSRNQPSDATPDLVRMTYRDSGRQRTDIHCSGAVRSQFFETRARSSIESHPERLLITSNSFRFPYWCHSQPDKIICSVMKFNARVLLD